MRKLELTGHLFSGAVYVAGVELQIKASRRVYCHSKEFAWGYHGSGAAQLALALCVRMWGADKAQRVYQNFKRRHIATLPESSFALTLQVGKYEDYL